MIDTCPDFNAANPFFQLNYEPALEALGNDYFDRVAAAEFPQHILRFRNDQLLPKLGLDAKVVTEADFIGAFGKFQGQQPCLALRYHGYQFGEYNPRLGDGRGFLYGQVRGTDGALYDFGTKGSGTTPYSRGGDGRLTLKGGVREVLAAEALHHLGVLTSRCFSLIETGEALWRGDEPSPTRAAVMVRFSRSHLRFGTFERLHYFNRKDLIQKLLDHVMQQYYPELSQDSDAATSAQGQFRPEQYAWFYAELVRRVAELAAQWMSVGFCHAVLNTDNMSITGESFDYGPYAFIKTYNPNFAAAYFDYYGRYSYGNQPGICRLNLELLQQPLEAVISLRDLEAGLAKFTDYYYVAYRQRMLHKLGFDQVPRAEGDELLRLTIQLLADTQVEYHTFFLELTQQFDFSWRGQGHILDQAAFISITDSNILKSWRQIYQRILLSLPESEMVCVKQRLRQTNPAAVLLRPKIEAVWQKITDEDDWNPFYNLVQQVQNPYLAPSP